MIKDDLTLDGTPTLNLASFVTTYMVSSSTSSPETEKEKPHTLPLRDRRANHNNKDAHVEQPN